MLNFFAKCLLVLTSLSPVLVANAINQFERGEPWISYIWWLIVALVLVLFCWGLLRYAANKAEKYEFHIKEIERNDQELLAFLLVYLLPFVTSENLSFASQILTSVYVFSIIVIAIAYAGAFHFNPVMRMFGYRFYAVKNHYGVSTLLISKTDLRRPDTKLLTVRLAWDVHLHVGDSDD